MDQSHRNLTFEKLMSPETIRLLSLISSKDQIINSSLINTLIKKDHPNPALRKDFVEMLSLSKLKKISSISFTDSNKVNSTNSVLYPYHQFL